MKHIKHFLLLLLFLAQAFIYANSQIRVACLGNSITFGSGLDNRSTESYPSQLKQLLGINYEVRNYGVPGTTMLKDNSTDDEADQEHWSYWEPHEHSKDVGGLEEFQKALAWEPNIVIIKFGTNDARGAIWPSTANDGRNNFFKTYVEFIDAFKALPTKPTIYICYPIPFYKLERSADREQARVIREEVIPLVKQIALHADVKLIDLHSLFVNKDVDQYYLTNENDYVHPNAAGAALIAQEVYKTIIMNE